MNKYKQQLCCIIYCVIIMHHYFENVKNYNSLKRGVYRPDCTYKTAKIILRKMFTLIWSGYLKCHRGRKHYGLYTSV